MARVDPGDILTRPADLPDAVVRYGGHAEALVDLHLPPHDMVAHRPGRPLVVLLHGGFWRASDWRARSRFQSHTGSFPSSRT